MSSSTTRPVSDGVAGPAQTASDLVFQLARDGNCTALLGVVAGGDVLCGAAMGASALPRWWGWWSVVDHAAAVEQDDGEQDDGDAGRGEASKTAFGADGVHQAEDEGRDHHQLIRGRHLAPWLLR